MRPSGPPQATNKNLLSEDDAWPKAAGVPVERFKSMPEGTKFPLSLISFEDTPTGLIRAHYYVVRDAIAEDKTRATPEAARAASENFERRKAELADIERRDADLIHTGDRVLDFLEKVMKRKGGDDQLLEIFTKAEGEGVEFSTQEGTDALALSPVDLKKLARLLEKDYGMPPDPKAEG